MSMDDAASSSGSEISTDGEYNHAVPTEFPNVLFMTPTPSKATAEDRRRSLGNDNNKPRKSLPPPPPPTVLFCQEKQPEQREEEEPLSPRTRRKSTRRESTTTNSPNKAKKRALHRPSSPRIGVPRRNKSRSTASLSSGGESQSSPVSTTSSNEQQQPEQPTKKESHRHHQKKAGGGEDVNKHNSRRKSSRRGSSRGSGMSQSVPNHHQHGERLRRSNSSTIKRGGKGEGGQDKDSVRRRLHESMPTGLNYSPGSGKPRSTSSSSSLPEGVPLDIEVQGEQKSSRSRSRSSSSKKRPLTSGKKISFHESISDGLDFSHNNAGANNEMDKTTTTTVRSHGNRKKKPDFNASMPEGLDLGDGGNEMDATRQGSPRHRRKSYHGNKKSNSHTSTPDGSDLANNTNKKKNDMDGSSRRNSGDNCQRKKKHDFNSSMPEGLDLSGDAHGNDKGMDSTGRSSRRHNGRRHQPHQSGKRQKKPDFNASMPDRLDFGESLDGDGIETTNETTTTRRRRHNSGRRQRKPDFNASMPDRLDFSEGTIDGDDLATGEGRGPPKERGRRKNPLNASGRSSGGTRRSLSGDAKTRSPSGDARMRTPSDDVKLSPNNQGRSRSKSPRGLSSSTSNGVDLSSSGIGRRSTGHEPPRRRKSRDFNASASRPDRLDQSRSDSRKRPNSRRSLTDRSAGDSSKAEDEGSSSLQSTPKTDKDALLEVMTADQVYDLYFPEVGYFDWKKWNRDLKEKEKQSTRRRQSSGRVNGRGMDRSRPVRRKTLEESRRRSTAIREDSNKPDREQATNRRRSSAIHVGAVKADQEQATNVAEIVALPGAKTQQETNEGFADFSQSQLTETHLEHDFAKFDENMSYGGGVGVGSGNGPERCPGQKEPIRRRLSSSNFAGYDDKGGVDSRSGHLVRQDSAAKELGKLANFMSSIDLLSNQEVSQKDPEPEEDKRSSRCCVIL